MKKFFKKLQDKANSLAIKAKCAVESTKGEGYIDTGVKIIIGVVVGAVILAGLYALFDNVILVEYKGYRIIIPLREMVVNFPNNVSGDDYKDLVVRHHKLVSNMLGADIDFLVLWFLIGLWIGGIVGVVTMCIFQVSKSK